MLTWIREDRIGLFSFQPFSNFKSLRDKNFTSFVLSLLSMICFLGALVVVSMVCLSSANCNPTNRGYQLFYFRGHLPFTQVMRI